MRLGLTALTLVAASLVAAWLLTGRSQSAAAGVSWKVDKAPFALHIERDGKDLLVDAAGTAGPGSRLSYSLADGSQHTVTGLSSSKPIAGGTEYVLRTDEPRRTATLDVRRHGASVDVSWQLHPDGDVDTVFTAFHGPDRPEHFLGSGIQHAAIDLSGQLVQLKVAYSCGRSIVTPFFVSSAGYGVWFETNAVGHMELRGTHDGMACNDSNSANPLCPVVGAGDRLQACFKARSLAYRVFTGTPVEVVARFRSAAGRMPVPPVQELGPIKWRDRVSGRRELLDDVARLRRLRIPLTTVLLDNPWEKDGCWGTLSFDPRFGDPRSLTRALHAQGVGLMVWVSPWVSCAASGFAGAEALQTPQGWRAVDFTNPAARAEYRRKIAALVRAGVDGFKGDRGDETDLESLTFAGGPGRAVHNVFPQLFAQSVLAGGRHLSMFRSGWTGTPTTGAGVWTGDQTPDFAGLQDAVRSLASLGASGFAVAGSDIGGYATQDGTKILTPEVFARWSQLGAVSPIFEAGGADRAATFWTLGAKAVGAFRASTLLHAALFPYLYELARTSARTGAPILQPLALRYPADEHAWQADLELLVGADLLAAPVTSATRSPRVYLPAGRWVDLFAGTSVDGGRTVTRATPLAELPLYLRDGATIPFTVRTAELWRRAWPLDALQLAGRSGWLTASSSLTVARTRETSLLFVRRSPPTSVRAAGQTLPRVESVEALRRARSGWVWAAAPFRGALVKLAPGSGRIAVTAN